MGTEAGSHHMRGMHTSVGVNSDDVKHVARRIGGVIAAKGLTMVKPAAISMCRSGGQASGGPWRAERA